MGSSLERVKFDRDVRKRQRLFDLARELFPRKKLGTESYVHQRYNLTLIGERKVIVRFIEPALIVYTDRVEVIDKFVTVATFGAVWLDPIKEYGVPSTRILPLQPMAPLFDMLAYV